MKKTIKYKDDGSIDWLGMFDFINEENKIERQQIGNNMIGENSYGQLSFCRECNVCPSLSISQISLYDEDPYRATYICPNCFLTVWQEISSEKQKEDLMLLKEKWNNLQTENTHPSIDKVSNIINSYSPSIKALMFDTLYGPENKEDNFPDIDEIEEDKDE